MDIQDLEGDQFQVDKDDPFHTDGKDRYITTGSHPDDRKMVLVISWTDRSDEDPQVTRIISAREATKAEVKS